MARTFYVTIQDPREDEHLRTYLLQRAIDTLAAHGHDVTVSTRDPFEDERATLGAELLAAARRAEDLATALAIERGRRLASEPVSTAVSTTAPPPAWHSGVSTVE